MVRISVGNLQLKDFQLRSTNGPLMKTGSPGVTLFGMFSLFREPLDGRNGAFVLTENAARPLETFAAITREMDYLMGTRSATGGAEVRSSFRTLRLFALLSPHDHPRAAGHCDGGITRRLSHDRPAFISR
jgi:hypothetical protein